MKTLFENVIVDPSCQGHAATTGEVYRCTDKGMVAESKLPRPARRPRPTPLNQRRVSVYADAFEYLLRSKSLPYVAVDEAKKALFAGAKLKSFDFIIYRAEGKNILVDAIGGAKLRKAAPRTDIEDFRRWQEIFGDGFAAYFAFIVPVAESDLASAGDCWQYQDRWYTCHFVPVPSASNRLDAAEFDAHVATFDAVVNPPAP